MTGKDIKIRGSQGGEFDTYVAIPDVKEKTSAIVLASAVHGVNQDLRDLADIFASHGYIAVAPDLFWRTIPGPLEMGDDRTKERSQPREEIIKTGEVDLVDTLSYVRGLDESNGKVAVIGFCYGGPYAIVGPARLGYDAGISCHGSLMLPYLREMEGCTKTVAILWGDQDHAAPTEVQDAYLEATHRIPTLDVTIFPGVLHGYMMKGATKAYDRNAYEVSMKRTLEILDGLRHAGKAAGVRKAS